MVLARLVATLCVPAAATVEFWQCLAHCSTTLGSSIFTSGRILQAFCTHLVYNPLLVLSLVSVWALFWGGQQ